MSAASHETARVRAATAALSIEIQVISVKMVGVSPHAVHPSICTTAQCPTSGVREPLAHCTQSNLRLAALCSQCHLSSQRALLVTTIISIMPVQVTASLVVSSRACGAGPPLQKRRTNPLQRGTPDRPPGRRRRRRRLGLTCARALCEAQRRGALHRERGPEKCAARRGRHRQVREERAAAAELGLGDGVVAACAHHCVVTHLAELLSPLCPRACALADARAQVPAEPGASMRCFARSSPARNSGLA